jgi:hypothetical protein
MRRAHPRGHGGVHEERVAPEPRFPHGMRNVATAYISSASTDVAV